MGSLNGVNKDKSEKGDLNISKTALSRSKCSHEEKKDVCKTVSRLHFLGKRNVFQPPRSSLC